jgi:hypothetical protein
MSQASTLEERVSHVEQDLAQLRSQVERLRSKGNWIEQITGTFKDDAEFDEILRLGREARRADQSDAE